MRTTRLVKTFSFQEMDRAELTFDPDIRLNAKTLLLQLKENDEGLYSIAADISARTRITNPIKAVQWLGFDVEVSHVVDLDTRIQVTGDSYRLSDGITDYYHDGGSWVVAGASDWNSEQEVADNIATFPMNSDRKIQVVINLTTTDPKVTPTLKAAKIAYSSTIEFQEDYIYRSLIRQLKAEVRPITDYPVKLSAPSLTIDLVNDFPLETPYNVVDIDSVFNDTDDPDHLVDIFSSYDSGTKVITLTGSVDAGKIVWIKLVYVPEIAVTTSRDYSELAKVPALVIDDINIIDGSQLSDAYDDFVRDKGAGTAIRIPAPMKGTLAFSAMLVTDNPRDFTRSADELKRFFRRNPTIRSVGLDERFRLWLKEEFDMRTSANPGDLHTTRLVFHIVDALFYIGDATDVTIVKRFILTGDVNVTVENP